MSDKTELEKLRILLPHWIEHSHSHQEEFRKWATVAKDEGKADVADLIEKAISAMNEANNALEKGLDSLGGKVEGHHHHHHHH
ncbi:MAG: hypothetical protein J7L69_11220 [Desulfobulbaceae bacterium]|nr:hypothetical protein [Desulfobulbaceae bacterium]